MSLANPTMDVLFEVLSGEDGCADHFYDDCCTRCQGWRHLIERGYLSRSPDEVVTFNKAFRAQKKVPSGWQAQVEADGAERGGSMTRGDGVRETTVEADKQAGAVKIDGAADEEAARKHVLEVVRQMQDIVRRGE